MKHFKDITENYFNQDKLRQTLFPMNIVSPIIKDMKKYHLQYLSSQHVMVEHQKMQYHSTQYQSTCAE